LDDGGRLQPELAELAPTVNRGIYRKLQL